MPRLYHSSEEKRATESRNGALQFLQALEEIDRWLTAGQPTLTPDLIKALQYRAIVGLYDCAGKFRDGPVYLAGDDDSHEPPNYLEVPQLTADLCCYVNNNWDKPAIHLSSFTLWRLNWIHPFFGGNGRTSRAASYIVLCGRLGFRLPGEKTIPDYIVSERNEYLRALRDADRAWEKGIVDVSSMATLLERLLAKQFLSVVGLASGRTDLG